MSNEERESITQSGRRAYLDDKSDQDNPYLSDLDWDQWAAWSDGYTYMRRFCEETDLNELRKEFRRLIRRGLS